MHNGCDGTGNRAGSSPDLRIIVIKIDFKVSVTIIIMILMIIISHLLERFARLPDHSRQRIMAFPLATIAWS